MKQWSVIAILDRSAGNESVGEMWQETKIFENSTPLIEVVEWAAKRVHTGLAENFRGNLRLTIGQ